MFTINANITDLRVKERPIFKILYSMNSHGVATPEMSVEDARCYILFFSEGSNLSAFIGLYLPRTDRKFYYTHSANPFPYEAAQDVEVEARAFAEDMGFLLDEINLGAMPAEDKNRWIEEQFIFGFRKPEPVSGEGEHGTLPEEKPAAQAVEQPPAVPPAAAAVPPQAPVIELEEAPARQAAAQPSEPVQAPPQPVQAQPAAPVQQAPQPVVQPAAQPIIQLPVPSPDAPQIQQQAHPTPPQGYQQSQVHIHIQQPIAPQQQAPQLPKAPVAPRRPQKPAEPLQPETEPLVTETEPSSLRPDDLIEEAVKSGVVKPPTTKLKKDIRSATGVVSRDREALARLMASF